MSATNAQRLVESISSLYRGPGGACALLKDGQVIGQHAWGYADLEKRIPMTPATILPICSISKQFVCLVLAKILREPGAEAKAGAILRDMLPSTLSSNKELTIERLAAMQSGIRDYWALTVLWGSQADGVFKLDKDAPEALKRLGNFHFEPGTQYSYSNVNFYILGRIAERLTGKGLDQLLSDVFYEAGMKAAELRIANKTDCIGYEGVEEHGYFRALNRMEWSGDAGIAASLNDMISYEQYLDQQQTDSNSVYRQNTQAPTFIDGSSAFYGWGLSHAEIAGQNTMGHGGALRGFRLHRKHAPDARLSAVVMFNHEADPEAAVRYMLEKALQEPETESTEREPAEGWEGAYFDPEAELAITVSLGQTTGELMINNSFHAEKLYCSTPYEASNRSTTAMLSSDGILTLQKPRENRTITALRIPPSHSEDYSALVGQYRSEEIDSTFHVTGGSRSAGMLYGSFDGYLGEGPAHLMKQLGEDAWYLTCQRSLDSQAPGSWTVVFKRCGSGKVVGVTVGCWLARKVPYVKV